MQRHHQNASIANIMTTTTTPVQVNLSEEQQQAINNNRRDICSESTRITYNKNISKFINFLEECCEENSSFVAGGGSISSFVVPFDPCQAENKEIFLIGKRNGIRQYRCQTLVWHNITRNLVDLFLADDRNKYRYESTPSGDRVIKKTTDGKCVMLSFDSRRKVVDSLKFGRKQEKGKFNEDFANSISDLIKSIKLNNQEAKSNGQLEESDADAIPFTLFTYLCQYAVQTGNSFLWSMALLQWNCMSRSQNIDDLKFSNFSLCEDSIVIQFDRTKMDKEGKKTTPKHTYANPNQFEICLFTALGFYFMELNATWCIQREYLFINVGASAGSAAANYCAFIMKWAKQKKDKIMNFIRTDHVNAHGIRKGSATEATANTAEASLSSIFHRGEWSLGIVCKL